MTEQKKAKALSVLTREEEGEGEEARRCGEQKPSCQKRESAKADSCGEPGEERTAAGQSGNAATHLSESERQGGKYFK